MPGAGLSAHRLTPARQVEQCPARIGDTSAGSARSYDVDPGYKSLRLKLCCELVNRTEFEVASEERADRLGLALVDPQHPRAVSRPIDDVVLNAWVTETKLIPRASNRSTIRAKSARLEQAAERHALY